jgi:hypothetical protein
MRWSREEGFVRVLHPCEPFFSAPSHGGPFVAERDVSRAVDVHAKEMEGSVRPPVDPRLGRVSVACPCLRIRNVDGASVQLEVSRRGLAVALGAVHDDARVAQQVECFPRPPHHSE